MDNNLINVVEDSRMNGIAVSDEEAEMVLEHCMRKIKLIKPADERWYLPVLFADELKDYWFRKAVNAATVLIGTIKEANA